VPVPYRRRVQSKRVTVTLSQTAIDLLVSECDHRHRIEGTRVPPARIVNELILTHLVDRNGTAGTPAERPLSKKPKK
jgi:hypothetical protein